MKDIELLETWSCPDCAFTYDACHSLEDGTYSCPLCEAIALDAEVGRLRAVMEQAYLLAGVHDMLGIAALLRKEVRP